MSCAAVIMQSLQGGPSPDTPPVADWTCSDYSPTIGETLQFTDLSSNNPTSWNWYVNGALFSIDQNPTFYCGSSGNLSIKLTAGNVFGTSDNTQDIFVNSNE